MKKLCLVFMFVIMLTSISEAKKKEAEAYESVATPTIEEKSGKPPIVFQTVINSKMKGDELYDALYKWALTKSQNSSKFDTGLAVLGGTGQKVKRGEIITENKKAGIINFVYVSSFYSMGSQLFFSVLLEIKEDRFRVTFYDTKAFVVQTAAEQQIEKITGIYKKWYEAYIIDYKKLVYDLQKIANNEYEVDSDF